MLRLFQVIFILVNFLSSIPMLHAQAVSDEAADEQALKELEKTLNNPEARRENAKGNPNAQSSLNFFEKFPPYAQKELNEIVMMIMRESKDKAGKHVEAYQSGGAAGAQASFSPAVKARIQALEKKLLADPQFNSPANLEMMKTVMPAFLAKPGT